MVFVEIECFLLLFFGSYCKGLQSISTSANCIVNPQKVSQDYSLWENLFLCSNFFSLFYLNFYACLDLYTH